MSDKINSGDQVRVTGNHAQAGREGKVTNITTLSLFAFGTMREATVSFSDSKYTKDIPTSALKRLDGGGDDHASS
jgi:hypothetical protein